MSKYGLRWLGCLVIVALVGTGGALGSSCEDPTPLTAVGVSASAGTLTFGVENPTSNSLPGYVLGTIQVGGRRIQFEGAVMVDANSTRYYQIQFTGSITLVETVNMCGGHGISDTSDPIVNVIPEPVEE